MKLSIGEKIRDCRKSINLTQEQLAEKLCVSFQTVSRWENGNSYPDIEILPQLAQLFDVTMDYLFGNEGKQREDRANREFDKAIEILDLSICRKILAEPQRLGVVQSDKR